MKPHVRLAPGLLLFAGLHVFAREIPCEWSEVERLVVVGDVHNDAEQLIACLRAGGVMDEQQKWIGGKTQLVQMGDLIDPEPDLKKVMDLLMALEVQASDVGGRVHALLGNHEIMILRDHPGDLDESVSAPFGGPDGFKKALQADGRYGKWIRGHNTAIRINDMLFVHGGLSSEYATLPFAKINKDLMDALDLPVAGNRAHDPLGPLWFRGLATEENPTKLGNMLAPMMRHYGVKHLVIGHTVTQTRKITVKADGALIMTDVGMSKTHGGGPAMCLVIEKGKFFAVTSAEKQELPVK